MSLSTKEDPKNPAELQHPAFGVYRLGDRRPPTESERVPRAPHTPWIDEDTEQAQRYNANYAHSRDYISSLPSLTEPSRVDSGSSQLLEEEALLAFDQQSLGYSESSRSSNRTQEARFNSWGQETYSQRQDLIGLGGAFSHLDETRSTISEQQGHEGTPSTNPHTNRGFYVSTESQTQRRSDPRSINNRWVRRGRGNKGSERRKQDSADVQLSMSPKLPNPKPAPPRSKASKWNYSFNRDKNQAENNHRLRYVDPVNASETSENVQKSERSTAQRFHGNPNSTDTSGSYLLDFTANPVEPSDVYSPFVPIKVLNKSVETVDLQAVIDSRTAQNYVSARAAKSLELIPVEQQTREPRPGLDNDDGGVESIIGLCKLKWYFRGDSSLYSETFYIVDTDQYDIILGDIFVRKTSVVGKLGPGYDQIERPKKWFVVGRVFMILWSEPLGNNGTDTFSEIRRYVVVQTHSKHCLCHPIVTYGGRGTTKPGVVAEGHAPVISVDGEPQYHDDEDKGALKTAIRVHIEDAYLPDIDPYSRVNYRKVYTVEYNNPIRNIGRVVTASLDDLQRNSVVARVTTYTTSESQTALSDNEREDEPEQSVPTSVVFPTNGKVVEEPSTKETAKDTSVHRSLPIREGRRDLDSNAKTLVRNLWRGPKLGGGEWM